MICIPCKQQNHDSCVNKATCACQHVTEITQECILNWGNDLKGPF